MEAIQESKRVKNIDEAIVEFAQKHSINPQRCDFTLNSIETYIKDVKDTEFRHFNENIQEDLSYKDKIINEHIEFLQYYNITIFEITSCKIRLEFQVKFNDYSSHPKIILSPASDIPYKLYKPKKLFSLIFKEFNKIKARHSILIGIFDDAMIRNLKLLVKYIYTKKFLKKVKIPLFNGIKPNLTQESKLVMNFLQKENENQIIQVEKNEVIIEYMKAKFGKNGLNCYGQRIVSDYANNKENFIQDVDLESIKIIEKKNKILYISKIKGFVHHTKTRISVDHKIRFNTISRVNKPVSTGEEDNNIEITVSQRDTDKDSIGAGVELVSETINIRGHIGAHSIIEAIHLKVDGATHKDSTQFAKYADINRHKGTLRCHEAKINVLEGGVVHATKVDIETCLGGSIYAQDVTISQVKNYLKVYASNSITIRLISGEENSLNINYRMVPILVSKIDLIKEEIEDLEFSLEEATRHDPTSAYRFKEAIQKSKKEISKIEDSVKNAKISIKQTINGLNSIIFTIDDKNEILFKTDIQEYKPFYLEFTESKIILHPTQEQIILENNDT